MVNRLLGVVLLSAFAFDLSSGVDEILLDTRTALSDLGWTMSQGSEWQEMTSDDAEGNERRMHMVCQITKPNQNNWLRTQYIPVKGARRVYVEVEFTIRSCEDVPNVATCKETFNLYYYETDRDEATTTFPPWREDAYIKVDTIAADRRFRPGSADTNFETRDIGPLTKNGIYLAIQDTGACVALMHVRVYYKYCETSTRNLATFTRAIAGPELTSLEEARGTCVKNSIAVDGVSPSLYCNGEGEWTVPSGKCICAEGYEANPSSTKCTACSPGYFKSIAANTSCKRCPAFSSTRDAASTSCRCTFGYFRAPSDGFEQPCTTTPSKPVNLYKDVNQTSVSLYWEKPLSDGGRSELWYSVRCLRCEAGFKSCNPCRNRIKFSSKPDRLVTTEIRVDELHAYAFYKFQVVAQNEVSAISTSTGRPQNNVAIVKVRTNQAAPTAVLDVQVTELSSASFVVTWNPPEQMNGNLRHYEVSVRRIQNQGSVSSETVFLNRTARRRIRINSMLPSTNYVVKVRARTQEGFGPYSYPVQTKTLEEPTTVAGERAKTSPPPGGMDVVQLLMAVIGGVLLVVAVVAVIIFCLRRARASKLTKMDAEKQPMFNGSVSYTSSFASNQHKTYIDPTTYEDPHRAVREFTKEIDATCVKIEEVIGGGEFGEVCRGRLQPNNKTERDVAIKTLKSGYSTQQKLDFLGEASIMGQFDHPNVIRLEGVVTRSRPLMIITEFMENGSLDDFLRKHDTEFSVIQLVGMLRNISAGMKYLSDMGYVHRDLAARNILVNAQLICKVSDFGMSRVLEEDSEATYTTRGGKIPIRWTAPEAFTFRKFTSASDVWSYGIVMWEVMSYGERPYWGMSNRDVMNAVETGYRLPAPMDCPQVQHRLMLDCWKKDRNQRPKFGQIVTALDKMLRDPAQLKTKAGNERTRHPPPPAGRTGSTNQLLAGHTNGVSLARTISLPVASSPDTTQHTDSGDDGTGASDTTPCLPGDPPSCSHLRSIDVSSLGGWLESAGLAKYKDNFTRNGCASMEQVLQVKPSDLTRMGIENTEDQSRLMQMIRTTSGLHTENSNDVIAPDVTLPSYSESQRLTGISV